MIAYCKNCRQTHAVWNRLTDSVICGRCGARVRGQELMLSRDEVSASPNGHDVRPSTPRKRRSAKASAAS